MGTAGNMYSPEGSKGKRRAGFSVVLFDWLVWNLCRLKKGLREGDQN